MQIEEEKNRVSGGARDWARTAQSPRTFQRDRVLSEPADARVAPSGENLTQLTPSSCPSSSMMGASSDDVRWLPRRRVTEND
jgi:hypothetical protein